ncbi:MAG TPA: hypothetical protein ENI82_00125 [Bacteroidetes bacterium]|nr:hypothetical protein [Bacteroidota bacterium]
MKNRFYFLLMIVAILLTVNSCVEKTTVATQKIKTENKVISTLDKGFYKARFSPQSSKIIVTSPDDKGLAIYDFSEDAIGQLNSKPGAGINPLFTPDGKIVVFQSHEFKNRRRVTSIYLQNLNTLEIKPVITDKRNLKLLDVDEKNIYFLDGNNVYAYNLDSGNTTENPQDITLAFTDNDLNLVVYKNGKKKTLNPQGEGNYIWVSVSPDRKQILYNKAGKGTFIADLTGKTVADLGRLHAPKWSKDGKFIVGMNDYDDGQKYTKSDILMIDTKTKKKTNLTGNSEVIALYPDIDNSDKKVIYQNEEGRIYLMELKKDSKK